MQMIHKQVPKECSRFSSIVFVSGRTPQLVPLRTCTLYEIIVSVKIFVLECFVYRNFCHLLTTSMRDHTLTTLYIWKKITQSCVIFIFFIADKNFPSTNKFHLSPKLWIWHAAVQDFKLLLLITAHHLNITN